MRKDEVTRGKKGQGGITTGWSQGRKYENKSWKEEMKEVTWKYKQQGRKEG